jgi:hypothetical protein
MTTETIDHATLTKLADADAGAVHSARVVGQAGGWGILVKYGTTERALATQRSHQVRIFRKFETLVNYLKGVGIVRFDVDAVNYDADSVDATRTRPDSAAKLKSVHEAAAHDKWFREQIAQGLKEADDPATEWVSNEEAKTSWATKRAELVKRVKGSAAASEAPAS